MASSSSSITPELEHEVFLSFRCEDTPRNFTSHLDEAFRQKNIKTFIDDKLNRGEEISPSLLKAIEHSKISVIIFSKGYASSSWCPKELEEIIKCKNTHDQIVIPVFYDVDPSDVRNQIGDFGKAFAELEKRFMSDSEMLQRWRTALRDAANLSGYDSKNSRNEATLVKDVVNDVWRKLDYNSSVVPSKDLVGLESSIEEIENLLCSKSVCKLGIWGIGGIEKTTLAGDEHLNHGFTFRRKSFISRRKVLIVFDDVKKLEQIKCLMGVFGNFDSDSRIIITTKDKHVLRNYEVDHIHEMTRLSSHNALQLFALHAFKGNPPTEDYNELSSIVVAYTKCVPLALKVLGSFLFKRTKREWESALKNLRTSLYVDVHKVLKISYDRLNDKEKAAFLDIACFFKGYKRDLIEAILNARDFDSHISIHLLIERCLITTSFDTIRMHDLLVEMGREIVRQESIDDPGKHSRLWDPNAIFLVLKYNMRARAIRSICLDMFEVEELHLNPKAFNNMQNLRFLKIYEFKHGKKKFVNLKHIDISHSKRLCSIPDLSLMPNLESLKLEDYTNLLESFSSICNLHKLVILNLQGCKSFDNLPISSNCQSLRVVNLSNCSNLKEVLYLPNTVEELYLDGTVIKEFPSIGHLFRLVTLSLRKC
ncbi:protein SUPPRESSOR OF npr1-1, CONSTITUTIVE 1-like [Mangifera indica]|uniref:protein SUPPRESSOR OF npr1-1, CONSTITUTIVE 1-like n=1 Tax=Mangifera indica TaxID=29780 RepID=UPI001CFB5BA9|nr:protein SUPPRESSOR OF npr1-1, CONSTITUTIVE 1-like [Mangifera indica]